MQNNNQAPWPVRKGVYRSVGQSDFVPTSPPVRSPSPIVEIPETPSESSRYSTPINSPSVFKFEKSKSPPIVVRTTNVVREIPIELVCEVRGVRVVSVILLLFFLFLTRHHESTNESHASRLYAFQCLSTRGLYFGVYIQNTRIKNSQLRS